ncbi:MAG TPA: peptidylprolyl isomerase [Planctomycetes bacterium]|nr:peptidylprolyl isomerase [Planctomycetota bacterium]
MTQKHKAPTQVTIAATEEEGVLHQLVRKYWAPVLGVILTFAAIGVLLQYRALSQEESRVSSWDQLGKEVNLASLGPAFSAPSSDTLANVAENLEDAAAAPWAKGLEVGKRLEEGDKDGARRAAEELEGNWPDSALASQDLYPRQDGSGYATLRRHLEAGFAAQAAWEAEHPTLFSNPPLPDDAPRVRIKTSAGDIVVGLYSNYAPKHAENFLKLCREGFYDGIKFHRVVKDFMIQAGDPNTRNNDDPDSWGEGGPGYTLDPEIGNVWHFPGALSAASTQPGGPTSGSQFFIVTDENQHRLDGDYTVFGTLLEGQDVVDTIENGTTLGDRPEDPVVIESTEVLE